jgi:hypothetical protein
LEEGEAMNIRQIRAALDEAIEPEGHIHFWKNKNPVACRYVIVHAPEWCRWMMAAIDERDALLRRHEDNCDRCEIGKLCDLCAEARKVMESE